MEWALLLRLVLANDSICHTLQFTWQNVRVLDLQINSVYIDIGKCLYSEISDISVGGG